MTTLRSTSSSPAEQQAPLDSLSRTIEGLEARIDGLLASAGRARAARAEAAAAGSAETQRPDALTEIRRRQRMLEESRQRAEALRAEALRTQAQRQPADSAGVAPVPARHAPAQTLAQAPDTAGIGLAERLAALRDDLKHDISEAVSREIGDLQAGISQIDRRNDARDDATRATAEGLRRDLARLELRIEELRSLPGTGVEANMLAGEFEELHKQLAGLAREDQISGLGAKLDKVEQSLADFDQYGLKTAVGSLAFRVDGIKAHLEGLDPQAALGALDDKLVAIVEVLEEMSRQTPAAMDDIPALFVGLDERLDEISRAIAATARLARPQDGEALRRMEEQVGALSARLADFARPDADTAALIGDHLDRMAERMEALASGDQARDLTERLDRLAALMERNQKAPPSPELTGFLADISRKIDALDPLAVTGELADRLEQLAGRIDLLVESGAMTAAASLDLSGLQAIETRLGDIAARLDETTAAPQHDQRAIANLERQITHLADLLTTGHDGAMPAFYEERITAVEQSIATSDEFVIEAARQAAEAVVEAYGRAPAAAAGLGQGDLAAITALADDLRQLEELSQAADDRNLRSFEVLHDTMLSIAGRLDDIDARLKSGTASAAHEAAASRSAPVIRSKVAVTPRNVEAAEPAAVALRIPEMPVAPAEGGAAATETQEAGFSDFDFADLPEVTALSRPSEAPKQGLLARLRARLNRGTARTASTAVAAPAEAAVDLVAERTTMDPPPIVPENLLLAEPAEELLEPGSGAPDIRRILERVRASQNAGQRTAPAGDSDRADFISAARRAAQAAAEEVKAQRTTADDEKAAPRAGADTAGKAKGGQPSSLRRPLLMAAGAVLLVVMALPLVSVLSSNNRKTTTDAAINAPAVPATAVAPAPVETAAKPAATVTQPAATATAEKPKAAPPASTLAAAPAASKSTETSVAQAAAPAAPVAKPAPAAQAVAAPETATFTASAAAPTLASTTLLTQPAPTTAAAVKPQAMISVPQGLQPASLADAARAGDPVAFFEIAARYTEGRGLPQDAGTAAEWYERAADAGLAPAIYRLGNLYEKGNGVGKDLAKARDLYEKAATLGNASAMHNLAVLSATGVDGAPDYAKALKWFVAAADLGVSDSQYNLAILYARGNGVKQDLEESYKWFAIAARDGDSDAAAKRDEVANAMQPDQLQSARAKADLWKVKPLDAKANSVNAPADWTSDAKADKSASVDMKKAIRNIQAILNNNGYDAGPADGAMGARTVSAIKAFQKAVGQQPDGRIDDELVKALLARNS